jgi:uncharacterized protein YigE (DUF2233 family)
MAAFWFLISTWSRRCTVESHRRWCGSVRPLVLGLQVMCGAALGGEAFTVEHQGTDFDIYRLDRGEEQQLRFYWKRPDGSPYGAISALRQELASQGEKLTFAVNGGIYSRELEPLGLYVEDGERLAALSRGSGGGNFFLKPNGVFYITDEGARVVETAAYQPDGRVRYAVQSGPMLVIDGELHPRFIPGYHSRYVRNGVGVDRAGRVVFGISDAPVNFHDFGTLFRDRLDCPNAVYLDGKISQMYLPDLGRYALWSWKPFVSIIALTEGAETALAP